jgi:hypothetical protein
VPSQVPSKRRFTYGLQGAIYHKMATFTFTLSLLNHFKQSVLNSYNNYYVFETSELLVTCKIYFSNVCTKLYINYPKV